MRFLSIVDPVAVRTMISTFAGAFALAASLAHGGETLQGISPREKWACIKAHLAVFGGVDVPDGGEILYENRNRAILNAVEIRKR